MIAYKFLTDGAIGLYSGFRWPAPENGEPGGWVAVEGSPVPCKEGIHACRVEALLDWIDDELWQMELAGEVTEAFGLVVASRGRLLRRVPEWDDDAARGLVEACVWRVRDHVTDTLRRFRLAGASNEFAACRGLSELQARAAHHAVATRGFPAQACAYAADAVELARGGRPEAYTGETRDVGSAPAAIAANLAFVSAVAAGAIAADAADDPEAFTTGFEAERAWQRGWLLARLGMGPRRQGESPTARRAPDAQETMSSSSSR